MLEGSEFIRFIQNELFLQQIVDFRCGSGRLAWLFNPLNYTGVDFDDTAIEEARRNQPAHRFNVIKEGDPIEGYDVALAHDVFGSKGMTTDLATALRCFTQPRVLISEVISRYEIEEYVRAFDSNLYRLHRVVLHQTAADATIATMEFHKR